MPSPQPQPLSGDTRRLHADPLVQHFGPRCPIARRAVRALCEALRTAREASVRAGWETWRELFCRSSGSALDLAASRTARLAKHYGLDGESYPFDELLFALHTYYTWLVRLVTAHAMRNRHGSPIAPDRLAALRMEGLLSSWDTVASEALAAVLGDAAGVVPRYDPESLCQRAAGGSDPFKLLYQKLFPAWVRSALGEYYTPDWLAEYLLDASGYSGDGSSRLLDPACGSGTFLLQAIRRVRAASVQKDSDLCRAILHSVVGVDLNPLAVLTARANYLLAVADLVEEPGSLEIPVHLGDAILDDTGLAGRTGRFDFIVGNPPWIVWDNLPEEYRRRTRPLWERYGLFSLSASEARHGGGKKDLSMLMLYAAADRYLADGGRLAFVITQTLFQTKGAGDGFRRFRLGAEGPPLGVLQVDDMVRFHPFHGAANWTAAIVLEKGRPTVYPVPYTKWEPNGRLSTSGGAVIDWQSCFTRQRYRAHPIDPNRPSSPWCLQPEDLATDLAGLVGPSDYRAHLGANSGGANGIYWLELLGRQGPGILVRNLVGKAKHDVPLVEQAIEPDLLYPLVCWADVTRYHAQPKAHILLAQDVQSRRGIDLALMQERYPKTLAYLQRFQELLVRRAAYRRYQASAPYYSMYNIGQYTLAPIKVVWRRMDRRPSAAVLEAVDDPLLGVRPVIVQETCVQINVGSLDEAHYLCALLNSAVVQFLASSYGVRGGKGFGTPSMLDFLNLRRFDPADPRHAKLAMLSRQAHCTVSAGGDIHSIQARIDELAAALWNLGEGDLAAVDRELQRR